MYMYRYIPTRHVEETPPPEEGIRKSQTVWSSSGHGEHAESEELGLGYSCPYHSRCFHKPETLRPQCLNPKVDQLHVLALRLLLFW